MKKKLTRQGRNLLGWLRHWEISSGLQDERTPALTAAAKAEEKGALALFRRMVQGKYSKRG